MPARDNNSHTTFHRRLIQALEPVRQVFLAQTILAMLDSGIASSLCSRGYDPDELGKVLGLQPERVVALLLYAVNENLVIQQGTKFVASDRLRELLEFAPWYELLIGGYGRTLLDLPSLLQGHQYGARDVTRVGHGSSGISKYDTIPVVLQLLNSLPSLKVVADLGSADASYLLHICRAFPGVQGVAVEPDFGSAEQAKKIIAEEEMTQRISVYNERIQEFVKVHNDIDCYILAFVLQEVLAQEGREHVVSLLRTLMGKSLHVHLVVVEVDYKPRSARLRMGLGRSYYNPYFLLHELTKQQLCDRAEWLSIFSDAGCRVVTSAYPSDEVDPTHFEEAFLLVAEPL